MKDSDNPTIANAAVADSGVSVDELRQNIIADKDRAMEAIAAANKELVSGNRFEFIPDMTGQPGAAAAHHEYLRDHLRGLQVVSRTPFYSRFNTKWTIRGQTEPMQLLLSKARDAGGVVEGEDWMVVSWTSPIANLIQGTQPGEIIECRAAIYEVGESSKYESLLPWIENAEFTLYSGIAAIANEADLDAMIAEAVPSAELPPKEYMAKPSFGLSDIIVLVDEPQRAAMALPFGKSVMIEGPPGSGKTSIGIMRIAVLYDQQWEELGLKRDQDVPFHDYSTMRVLVYNDEMVEYLRSLAQSIGVEHAQVETTKDFFRRLCRSTKLLRGIERRDRPSLSLLKGRRESLHAYFAGFKSHITQFWSLNEESLRRSLFDLGPDFLALADCLNGWVKRIAEATVVDGRIKGMVGIADSLTDAYENIRSGRSQTRKAASFAGDLIESDGELGRWLALESIDQRSSEAKKLIEGAIRVACSRRDITHEMFGQTEYTTLLKTLRRDGAPERMVEAGDRLWHKQYKGELPGYSELDLAMTAWLGAPLLLSTNANRTPWIGSRFERLTHIVVDEAQDLSPSHITVLASQLVRDGTMTLVGDIHQNLNPYAGLQRWEDAKLTDPVMSAFGVNHRQTRQLGEFLQGLYSALFDEECQWEPSLKAIGRVPHAGTARSWDDIARAVAVEAIFWRDAIQGESGATVAVLYDGRVELKRLRRLKEQLEIALSDQIIQVDIALPDAGGEPLRRTDRVVIASVSQTKGLEFDVVIYVEPRPLWSKEMHEIDPRVRNGFYVATSRARAGLSICMSNLPSCIATLAQDGLCQKVEWAEDREEME